MVGDEREQSPSLERKEAIVTSDKQLLRYTNECRAYNGSRYVYRFHALPFETSKDYVNNTLVENKMQPETPYFAPLPPPGELYET